MDIRVELLKKEISDIVNRSINDFSIDANEIVHSQSSKILEEIIKVVRDDSLTDFMAMDEIVNILIKYDIDTGGKHDF